MDAFGLREEVTAFIVEKAKAYNMAKVVLFGSRATGCFSEKSDIDLAILGSSVDSFIVSLEEECPTLLSFDFVILSQGISKELEDRIDKEGVVLYEVCKL